MTIKNAYERIQDSITYRINNLELAEQTYPYEDQVMQPSYLKKTLDSYT
jgi:hypothetical protein